MIRAINYGCFLTLSLLLLLLCCLARGHGETDLPDLATLLTNVRGGPIELEATEREFFKISEPAARTIAERHLGIPQAPVNSWRVTATDREYMSGLLRQRPCWLLYYRFSSNSFLFKSAVVLVDGDTGCFWEAFTLPTARWWERVRSRNEQVIDRYKGNEVATPAAEFPPYDLNKALTLSTKGRAFPWKRAEQVIARHFVYTEGNVGYAIDRIEGTEIVPTVKGVPIWHIALEGLKLPDTGGDWAEPGEKPVQRKPIEEQNFFVNSRTGRLFGVSVFR